MKTKDVWKNESFDSFDSFRVKILLNVYTILDHGIALKFYEKLQKKIGFWVILEYFSRYITANIALERRIAQLLFRLLPIEECLA